MEKTNTLYKIYDFIISADFSMPELELITDDIIPEISFTQTNLASEVERLQPYIIQNSVAFHEGQVLLLIREIGHFLILNPNKVLVQFEQNCSVEKALPHIYSTVMTMLLQMRNLFPIHASAVTTEKGIHLFCGPSGAGKSTLATHLNVMGYPLFCDDKCILYWKEDNQKFYAKRAIPTVRLCEDALEHLSEVAWLKNGKEVTYKDNKLEFDIKERVHDSELPVASISMIRNINGNRLMRRLITGTQKSAIIQDQTFKRNFIPALGKNREHFTFIQNVATHIPIFTLLRPVETSIQRFSKFVAKSIDTI